MKKVRPTVADHPKLLSEWSLRNERLPSEVFLTVNARALWRCSLGHEWEALVPNRVRGCGCPICANKLLLRGFNDLQSRDPLVGATFSKKNELSSQDVLYCSRKSYLWECAEGHEWKASPHHRLARKQGCPYCSGKRVLRGVNDFASQRREEALEWSPENSLGPSEVHLYSNRKVAWVCKKDPTHTWRALVSNRARGSGCPSCVGSVSRLEDEVARVLEELLEMAPERSVRGLIGKRELDIYFPSLRLAVEVNGNYWHAKGPWEEDLAHGTAFTAEAQKTLACRGEGIYLVHLWEDEWKDAIRRQEFLRELVRLARVRVSIAPS